MRILWNNHRDIRHPAAGGAERTIHEVGSRLVARGHRVVLLTSRFRGGAKDEAVDGVRILRFPGNILPHLVAPLSTRGDLRPDVVVDDLAHVIPWFSERTTRLPGTVFFRHLHARTLPGQVARPLADGLTWLERQYARIYPRWTFVTESERSIADLGALGIPRPRCVRILPGIDSDAFRPGERSDEPSIVYFGGLREYKRPDHCLRAAKLLSDRGVRVRVVVVGAGAALPALVALRDHLGMGDRVEFRGRLSREELVAVVRSSWVNVHCAVAEGWCYSALEAAAAGVPTAGYRVPGLSESVLDGRTGLLVRDGEVTELADALEKILATQKDWRGRCREYAAGFRWDATASAWSAHLERIIG